jgi:hypothetical protein
MDVRNVEDTICHLLGELDGYKQHLKSHIFVLASTQSTYHTGSVFSFGLQIFPTLECFEDWLITESKGNIVDK